jgi:hypothetical protein
MYIWNGNWLCLFFLYDFSYWILEMFWHNINDKHSSRCWFIGFCPTSFPSRLKCKYLGLHDSPITNTIELYLWNVRSKARWWSSVFPPLLFKANEKPQELELFEVSRHCTLCIYEMGIDFAWFSSMIFLIEFWKCSHDVVFDFHCFTSLSSLFNFLETTFCIPPWHKGT